MSSSSSSLINDATKVVAEVAVAEVIQKKPVKVGKAEKKSEKKENPEKVEKAEKAEKAEKVKKVKKAEKAEKAVTQVVEMVNEMKHAFDSAGPEAVEAVETVEAVEAVEPVGAPEELLTIEFYEDEPEADGDDDALDFEELRLQGEETPIASGLRFNPIPQVIPDEPASSTRSVFRHEFSQDCFALLKQFSLQNMHLPRKEYKSAWEAFATENAELISQEAARLADSGYIGDVLVKMFKTAKYYITKKEKRKTSPASSASSAADADDVNADVADDDATVSDSGDQVIAGKKRRPYIPLDKSILQEMDLHIKASIAKNTKPSTCYSSFCQEFGGAFQREIARLICLEGRDNAACVSFTEKGAEEKLKKTYKNRMFLLLRDTSAAVSPVQVQVQAVD
jgi:hypothetical protein